jgi:hypothetical protein
MDNFNLAKLLYVDIIESKPEESDILYNMEVTFKSNKWIIRRKLSEFKNLIVSLQNLKFTILPEIKNISVKETNTSISNALQYITHRYDLLSNILVKEFFFQTRDYNEFTIEVNKENLEQIYTFKLEDSDMTMSDYHYDTELGLLLITLEDLSFYSRIGRFWSLIDYEILGNFMVYQRVFDKNNKPYFRKIITKNFDVGVCKLEMDIKKIYVGLDNGGIHIFNINVVNSSSETFITVTEGNFVKLSNERITGLCKYNDYLFVSSKENKVYILDTNSSLLDCKFVGSLKKRMEGKGYINKIYIEKNLKKLMVSTITDKFFVYDITDQGKIELNNEYEIGDTIRNIYWRMSNILVALDNKIVIYNIKEKSFEHIRLNGKDELSHSSKYFKLSYGLSITSISFFTDMKLIILGLSSGTIITISSKSFELKFAKKMSEYSISKMILLEDNYILIASDKKGGIYFLKFGI